jgi:Zn-dependent metalloprotease
LQNAQRRAAAPIPTGPLSFSTGGEPQRTVYNCNNQEDLPGSVARVEGSAASGDTAIDEAFDGLGATYEFFWEVYDRGSIDDQDMRLDGHVHYGKNYDNAFWDGQRMVFGDGDGELFNRFTIALDVIGHELAHGVTEDEAALAYWQQSGALNESVSDVFGSLVKQYSLKQTAKDADWLIGAGLLGPKVKGKALRSMKAPGTAYDDPVLGKDPQPAHMRDYVRTFRDNGGVHINSGIPNHAFYLAATALGGNAWEKAGRIWYDALRSPRIRPTAQFRTFARVTVAVAGQLYGADGAEQKAVRAAWTKVGVRL